MGIHWDWYAFLCLKSNTFQSDQGLNFNWWFQLLDFFVDLLMCLGSLSCYVTRFQPSPRADGLTFDSRILVYREIHSWLNDCRIPSFCGCEIIPNHHPFTTQKVFVNVVFGFYQTLHIPLTHNNAPDQYTSKMSLFPEVATLADDQSINEFSLLLALLIPIKALL